MAWEKHPGPWEDVLFTLVIAALGLLSWSLVARKGTEDVPAMALFYTDFLSLCCRDTQAEKQWWIGAFDCKEADVPVDWDCPLPSDVALKVPGAVGPTILLYDSGEVQRAAYERRNDHPIVFCTNLKKAHEYLRGRGALAGPIQDGGGTQFFEVRDPEGNVIEICKEP